MPDLNALLLDNAAAAFGAVIVVVLLLAVLVVAQSIKLGRATRRYDELVHGVSGGSLADVLDVHIGRIDQVVAALEEMRSTQQFLEARSRGSLQHIGMVRFNPFDDTGSDQSFAIALLDDRRDGIVLSSLHGRNVTRIYAKPVEGGSSRHHLSDEEADAIRIAVEGTRAADPA